MNGAEATWLLKNNYSGPLLHLDSVNIAYGVDSRRFEAVREATFELPHNTSLCFVGESGSGKTTLALAIPHLLPATATVTGRLFFEGRDLLTIARTEMYEIRRTRISVIFQDAAGSLVPGVRVEKQIRRAISFRLGISDGDTVRKKTHELLEAVGLGDVDRVLKSFPHELSGGMSQRVMIALALSVTPTLLIADEPVSSLDAITQVHILKLLLKLKEHYGFAILFVTHDLRVASMFDNVGVLRRGEIVEMGTAASVLQDPAHPYTRELISAVGSLSSFNGIVF